MRKVTLGNETFLVNRLSRAAIEAITSKYPILHGCSVRGTDRDTQAFLDGWLILMHQATRGINPEVTDDFVGCDRIAEKLSYMRPEGLHDSIRQVLEASELVPETVN